MTVKTMSFSMPCFEKAGLNHPIIHVSDGEEAVDYLSGTMASQTALVILCRS